LADKEGWQQIRKNDQEVETVQKKQSKFQSFNQVIQREEELFARFYQDQVNNRNLNHNGSPSANSRQSERNYVADVEQLNKNINPAGGIQNQVGGQNNNDSDSDNTVNSVNKQRIKSKKKSKTRQCISFFGSCRQKNESKEQKDY